MSKVKVQCHDGHVESLYVYLSRIAKKNNSTLYLLEQYLNKKLLEDSELAEIRDIILTVSADISKLPSHLIVGDEDEGL